MLLHWPILLEQSAVAILDTPTFLIVPALVARETQDDQRGPVQFHSLPLVFFHQKRCQLFQCLGFLPPIDFSLLVHQLLY